MVRVVIRVESSLRGILKPAGSDRAVAAAFRVSSRHFYPVIIPSNRIRVLRCSEACASALSDTATGHRSHRRSAFVDEDRCAWFRTALRMHPRASLIDPQCTLAQNDRLPNRRLK
jgi:hypothetical protein